MSGPASNPSAMTPEESRNSTKRIGVFVLGAFNMLSWLMFATSRWFGEDIGEITPYMWSQFLMLVVVQFLVTVPALVLAWRNERLTLALWLVAIPWLYWFGTAFAFFIAVLIYGF